MRVAMGIFAHEDKPEDQIISLYNLYKSRRFCSSTPTLFNSGTPHSQLSSCYLYKVDDTIESIMYRGIAENAFLSKWAGLGGSWTSVRGTGSHIAGTNGESQGVIPFLKCIMINYVQSIKAAKEKVLDVLTWSLGIVMFWNF